MISLLGSFKKTFNLIKDHKSLFGMLLLIQLVFFAVFFSIQIHYWLKIMDSSLAVMDYLGAQNFEESAIESSLMNNTNILGDDPMLVYRNAKSIIDNSIILAFLSLLCFVAFEGSLWALTDSMLNKKRNLLSYFGKFTFLTIAYSLVLYLILFLAFKTMSIADTATMTAGTYVVLSLMFLFVIFIFVSFTMIGKYKLREILKETLAGIREKWKILLPALLFTLVILALFSYVIVLIQELSFVIVLLAAIAFVFSFVFCRIFLYVVMD